MLISFSREIFDCNTATLGCCRMRRKTFVSSGFLLSCVIPNEGLWSARFRLIYTRIAQLNHVGVGTQCDWPARLLPSMLVVDLATKVLAWLLLCHRNSGQLRRKQV